MRALRISAALLILSTTLALPEDPSAHLSVTVIDRTGAAIAGAEIAIDGQIRSTTKADSKGEATLAAVPGKHNLSITARIFKPWSREIEVYGNAYQSVVAVLSVDCERSICDVIETSNESTTTNSKKSSLLEAAESQKVHTQTAQQGSLNVRVTDLTGAFVPEAKIEVRSSKSNVTTEAESDAHGNAIVPLESDIYFVSVTARGFATWSGRVDLQQSVSQSILAELRVGGGGGIEVTPIDSGIETERQILDVSIPFKPLESLTDLPGRKMGRPKWPHHAQS